MNAVHESSDRYVAIRGLYQIQFRAAGGVVVSRRVRFLRTFKVGDRTAASFERTSSKSRDIFIASRFDWIREIEQNLMYGNCRMGRKVSVAELTK